MTLNQSMRAAFKPSALSLALSAAIATPLAQAQSQDAFSLEEVIVTAQKREQGLQDVGIAISAFQEKPWRQWG